MSGSSAPQLAQALGMLRKRAAAVSRSASMLSDVSFSARDCPSGDEASEWELCLACSAALSTPSAAALACASACPAGSMPPLSSSTGSARKRGPARVWQPSQKQSERGGWGAIECSMLEMQGQGTGGS